MVKIFSIWIFMMKIQSKIKRLVQLKFLSMNYIKKVFYTSFTSQSNFSSSKGYLDQWFNIPDRHGNDSNGEIHLILRYDKLKV